MSVLQYGRGKAPAAQSHHSLLVAMLADCGENSHWHLAILLCHALQCCEPPEWLALCAACQSAQAVQLHGLAVCSSCWSQLAELLRAICIFEATLHACL